MSVAAASFRRPSYGGMTPGYGLQSPPVLRADRSAASGFRHRAMVVAMTVVRMMEMSIDQIVEVVSMRHYFMSTVRPMHMF